MLNSVFIFNKYLLYLPINLKKIKMKLVKGFLAIALISIIAVSCTEAKKGAEKDIKDAVESVSDAADKAVNATKDAADATKEAAEDAVEATSEVIDSLKSDAKKVVDSVKATAEKM